MDEFAFSGWLLFYATILGINIWAGCINRGALRGFMFGLAAFQAIITVGFMVEEVVNHI